ncbi:MAG: energy-coupling factor transporter transmembrane component T [Bacillota bacterium]
MLEGITFGQYVPGKSVIHRLDPRTKIFCALFFVLAVLLAGSRPLYGLLTLLVLALLRLAGMPRRVVFHTLKPFWFILVLSFLLQVFFTPGEAVWRAGIFQPTREGIALGGQLCWRLAATIVVSSLLTLTTSPLELTAAVERLLAPLARVGLPAGELAMMMTMAVRFLPTLLREALTIKKAQQARGVDFNSGWPWQRLANTIPLLVPLFAGAFARAEELAAAMEARGYRVGVRRGRLHPLCFEGRDFAAAGAAVAILVLTVIFRT